MAYEPQSYQGVPYDPINNKDFAGGYQQVMDKLDPAGLLHGQPVAPTYLGGSAEAQAALQQQYQAGIGQGGMLQAYGVGVADQGVNMLGAASGAAAGDRMNANAMIAQGNAIGQQGLQLQGNAALNAVEAAKQRTDSAALMQMRQGMDQANAAAMARAASARGGNQAAAMRMAAADAANANQNVVAGSALMRANEDAARQQRIMQANQFASQAFGQQGALGYGMQGQGVGYGLQATNTQANIGGQVADVGLGQGQLGTQTTGQYLDAQARSNESIMGASQKQQAAELEQKGGMIGGLMGGLGSLFS